MPLLVPLLAHVGPRPHTIPGYPEYQLRLLLRRRKGYHELNSGTLQMLMRPAAARGVLFDYSCIPDIGTLVSI